MSEPKNDGGPAFPVCPGREGPIADRFLRHVAMGTGDLAPCWPWTGGRRPKGYGVFAITSRKQTPAHRFSFALYHGREPREMVLHMCDNPCCVNPTHLMDGTHGENMRQMADRRRAAREDRHHKAILTPFEVVAIVALSRSGDYSTRELAALFSVSQPTISAISRGEQWPDMVAMADAMLAARSATDA